MKVIAFNGSPRAEGNTYTGLKIVAEQLEKEGIEVEIVYVGNQKMHGCLGCGGCARNKNEKCVINDDLVNECVQKIKEADGILLGSPVHFAGVGGTMKSFLDRLFYVSHANGNFLRHKVGASVVAVRRSGGVSTFDELNHYLQFAEMMIPTSNYWNVIHGAAKGEVVQDEEGVQCFQVLGKNMAWLMKTIDSSRIARPQQENKKYMNFIR